MEAELVELRSGATPDYCAKLLVVGTEVIKPTVAYLLSGPKDVVGVKVRHFILLGLTVFILLCMRYLCSP